MARAENVTDVGISETPAALPPRAGERTLDLLARLDSVSDAKFAELRNALFVEGEGAGSLARGEAPRKRLELRYRMRDMPRVLGKDPQAIRDAEKAGKLPAPLRDERGRRKPFTMAQVEHMREVFDCRPWRAAEDPPVVLAPINYKGGAVKTTVAKHLGDYLGQKGFRVLMVDCDPQGSLTALYGQIPDFDVDVEQTLLPFLAFGGPSNLHYAVQETYWPTVKLIPANLELGTAEFDLAGRLARGDRDDLSVLDLLRVGIEDVARDFDVVILDPPPALGLISTSVLRAANAIVVPIPPGIMDFASTKTFIKMVRATLGQLYDAGLGRDYSFFKFVATRVDLQQAADNDVLSKLKECFGDALLDEMIVKSSEIANAAAAMMSVYEQPEAYGSRETYKRCLRSLDGVCGRLLLEIRRSWPSHRERLRKEGIL